MCDEPTVGPRPRWAHGASGPWEVAAESAVGQVHLRAPSLTKRLSSKGGGSGSPPTGLTLGDVTSWGGAGSRYVVYFSVLNSCGQILLCLLRAVRG